jgi:inorganic triphosphatase YgiF
LLLELVASPNSLPLLRSALENTGATAAPRRQLVSNTYYDTPDFSLSRQHLSFCVRKRGVQRVQVLTDFAGKGTKTAGGGEWSDRIDGDEPDLSAPQTGHRLRAVGGEDLRLLFATRARRTVLKATPEAASEIIVTLDDGEILPGNCPTPEQDCRLTLELGKGEPGPAYDTALKLLE